MSEDSPSIAKLLIGTKFAPKDCVWLSSYAFVENLQLVCRVHQLVQQVELPALLLATLSIQSKFVRMPRSVPGRGPTINFILLCEQYVCALCALAHACECDGLQ